MENDGAFQPVIHARRTKQSGGAARLCRFLSSALSDLASCALLVVAAAVRISAGVSAATTAMGLVTGMSSTAAARRGLMGSAGMLHSGMACAGTRTASIRTRSVAAALVAVLAAVLATVLAIGHSARTAVVAASAFAAESMAAPAVAIAPAAPRPHPEEDAIVEISRPVIAHGRALVGRIAVIAVRAGGLNADVHHKLGLGGRRQGQAGEQCSSAK